jgi:hypothetical protein
MLPHQRTSKGYGRWSDSSAGLVASIALFSTAGKGTAILPLLYEHRDLCLRPMQVELVKMKVVARPPSSDAAASSTNYDAVAAHATIEALKTDAAKAKARALDADNQKRHKLVLAACVPPTAASPKAAADRLYLNMTNTLAGNDDVQVTTLGWTFLQQSSVPWKAVDEKSKSWALRRFGDFAIVEECIARSYRPKLIQNPQVAAFRQTLLLFMRNATGKPAWAYADHHFSSVAPPPDHAPVPAPAPTQEAKRPRRKAAKPPQLHNSNDDESGEDITEQPYEVQVARIVSFIGRCTVSTADGKKGGRMDGHVAEMLKPFVGVRTSLEIIYL